MKYQLLFLVLAMVGCGSGGGSESTPGVPSPTVLMPGATEKTYVVEISGDGVQFTLSIFADLGESDEEQLVIGPTTVPNGQTLYYTVTGQTFSGGVSRMNAVPANLSIQLKQDGVAGESATLTTAGTFHTFTNR